MAPKQPPHPLGAATPTLFSGHPMTIPTSGSWQLHHHTESASHTPGLQGMKVPQPNHGLLSVEFVTWPQEPPPYPLCQSTIAIERTFTFTRSVSFAAGKSRQMPHIAFHVSDFTNPYSLPTLVICAAGGHARQRGVNLGMYATAFIACLDVCRSRFSSYQFALINREIRVIIMLYSRLYER